MTTLKCNFCNQSEKNIEKLIRGIDEVHICNRCVPKCQAIIDEILNSTNNGENIVFSNPKEIKEILDQRVIGQEVAKKKLSVALFKHLKGNSHKKNNVLLIGPSGVGKTELARSIAEIKNLPFAIVDATALTEAGYVGDDVESILLRLIQASDNDLEKAARGIIYVDEIDKIKRKGENVSITRDVSGEGVQQALLKIIEGTVAKIPADGGRKHPNGQFIELDTTNILFIFGGAFEGLDKIIKRRTSKSSSIGFDSKEAVKADYINENVIYEDLVKFGMVPEFIGRIPVVAQLNELSKDELIEILKLSMLDEYKDFNLTFDDSSFDSIAQKAIERKVGARGLKAILEELTFDFIYNGESAHFTAENVNKILI